MNYSRIYNALISKRVNAPATRTGPGSCERHHIISRSMGGTDESSNLVTLTVREHFVAHLLLAKIYPQSGMVHAVFKMACTRRDTPDMKVTSHTYERLRKAHAERVSNDEVAKEKKSLASKGRKQSPEHVEARTKSRLEGGNWHSEETRRKISETTKKSFEEGRVNPMLGKTLDPKFYEKGVAVRRANGSYGWSESQREKMKTLVKPKGYSLPEERVSKIKEGYCVKIVCPHCGKDGYRMTMARWHFNNCKIFKERIISNDEPTGST